MAYSGIQMFMEKLKQLINCNDNPLINIPSIIRKRPQFQLLHEELGSMIQTLFIDEHQDLYDQLEKFNDLKKRFIYAAEEAEYIVDLFLCGVHVRKNDDARRSFKSLVDLFLSWVHIKSAAEYIVDLFLSRVTNGHFPTSEDFERSLNLDDVRRSFESIKVEFLSITIDNMKLDSSERTLNQSAPRNSLRSKDEIIVGIDDDAELIRDKLVQDQKKVDVVSIVGMGGIGKTTLATKVFNDGYVKYHFHVRVWVTVSQTYDKRGVLIQILESIRAQLHLQNATDSKLREMVHKHLMGKRYLIVIDDIWHIETWDQVKLFFPNDNTGSRILLTTRLTEVAKHASSDGVIHHLGYLDKEGSLDLLRKKVFHGNEFPEWSIKPGMQIVENCKGLPLSVVVIAGILAKEAWNRKWWEEIAYRTGSYIVGDQNGCLETLALSYNHLPLHLRECFLYLGGFPEDYQFGVKRLIWLWVAEGFIQQAGSRSLEDIAESYLMDLIDRNLVTVSRRSNTSGAVKACTLHDLVRELCLRKAREEGFFLIKDRPILSSNVIITPPYKPVRMFINDDINLLVPSAQNQNLRSVLFFRYLRRGILGLPANSFRSFMLLRALDLRRCILYDFPEGMELLVHLRYLAIRIDSAGFPSSICKLWGLQTLIYIRLLKNITRQNTTVLPRNISDLVNLRHLWGYYTSFILPSIEKPMNLQTISDVRLGDEVGNFQKCFPYVKKLRCTVYRDEERDFQSLTCLEKLKLTGSRSLNRNCFTFPATLRALTLNRCKLPWSQMSVIQSLPNLQVLKLRLDAFEGSCWNTDGQEFRQLKFLRLERLNIKQWEANSTSFPCLRQLEIYSCKDLKEIPDNIGDIPTLELIRIGHCNDSVNESVRKIQKEQNDLGNYDLKVRKIQKEQNDLGNYQLKFESEF